MNRIIYLLATLFIFASANNRPFVYGDLLGRMGNYLFEVATTCAVAWDNDAIPFFPEIEKIKNARYKNRTTFDLCHFVLFRCNTIHPPKDHKIAFEWSTPTTGYKPIPYKPNMKISGYSQSYKYFAHHRDKLIQLFAPIAKVDSYIRRKYKQILLHPKSVSVHVRNYHKEVPGNEFLQFDSEYYENAMKLFPNDSLFVVTSDDIDFAKRIIPMQNTRRVIFINKEKFYVDFHIQRLCKSNIIANSSFSWWSAWMNENPNKVVVRPDRWLGGYADIDCPDDWIRIKASCYQDRR